MKTAACFCLLFVLSFSAKAQDTLFSKNFNDLDIFTDSRAYLSSSPDAFPMVASQPNSTLTADGSPALVLNFGNMIARSLFGSTPPINSPLYIVQLKSVGSYDTIKTSFDLRAKTSSQYGNSPMLSAFPRFIVFYNYTNTVSTKYYSTPYNLMGSFPINLELGDYTSSVSFLANPSVTDLKRVTMVYPQGSSAFRQFTLRIMYPTGNRMFQVQLKSGFKLVNESELKSTLLSDFCAGTDNPSDCQTKATFNSGIMGPGTDYDNNILIDNISIIGIHKKLTTSLDESAWLEANAPQIKKAYTFLGAEIVDLTSYSGLAIVEMKDGSRKKILK